MNAERHMALKYLHASEASGRPTIQFFIGPEEEDRINAEYSHRIVFPFDDPIQRGAGALRQMKKDHGAVALHNVWLNGSCAFSHIKSQDIVPGFCRRLRKYGPTKFKASAAAESSVLENGLTPAKTPT